MAAYAPFDELGNRMRYVQRAYFTVGHIIPEFIKSHKVDLLIVGHHERQGIYHILGSTAFALISHAECDVLTIPYPRY